MSRFAAFAAFALLAGGLVPACARDTVQPAATARVAESTTAPLLYAAWDDPASFDQLIALLDDPDAEALPGLVDDLIAEALEGVPAGADAKTRMLNLVWYIHTHFVSGVPEPSYTTSGALRQRVAECGGSSLALQLAARRLGFATRGVGHFGVPRQGGHTAVEVYWDDAWHYLDPSFGAFFTDDGTVAGDVLDFDTIHQQRLGAAANVFYADVPGRLGADYPYPKPATLGAMFGRSQVSQPGAGDYALFLPNTVAATVYAPDRVLETTYALAMTAPERRLGDHDGSIDDLALHRSDAGVYDGSSLYFVGDLSSSHGVLYGVLTFKLTGLTPGQTVTWEGDVLDGPPEAVRVEARKVMVGDVSRGPKRISLTATALRDEAEISLETDRRTRVLFDAHRFTVK